MRVFISWSGNTSKQAATELRDWLPDVIQSVEPWMSRVDIEAGAGWNAEITEELQEAAFGILCITAANQLAPWLLFEAGALAMALGTRQLGKAREVKPRVCPYFLGVEPEEIVEGPINQFQGKRANRAGTRELVRAINARLSETGGNALSDERLERAFERNWPTLAQKLSELPPEEEEAPERSLEDKIDDILNAVRRIDAESLRLRRPRRTGLPDSCFRGAASGDTLDWAAGKSSLGRIQRAELEKHVRALEAFGKNVTDDVEWAQWLHDLGDVDPATVAAFLNRGAREVRPDAWRKRATGDQEPSEGDEVGDAEGDSAGPPSGSRQDRSSAEDDGD